MASADQLIKSIEPGSTEYGDRQTLEAGLATAVSGTPSGPAATAAASRAVPVDSTTDPLAAVLSGQLDIGSGGPITDGLSVGAGAGPGGAPEQQHPVKVRLQQVATQAKSPLTRAAARNELRRLVREPL